MNVSSSTTAPRIGIGLPNVMPGVSGHLLLEWARRAEATGFAFVSTIDRPAYPSFDPLTTLAAVAGATSRIGLITNAQLGPTWADLPLARATASLADLSGGRLTLGLGIGARELDYQVAERPFHTRGRAFDRQLETLQRAWSGEPIAEGERIGPTPPGGRVPVLVGGYGDHAVRRTIRWADGWTGAGGALERSTPMIAAVRDAWHQARRPGQPRLAGLAYFSVGKAEASDAFLRHYYAYGGPLADAVARAAVHSPDGISRIVDRYREAGFTDIVFTPSVAELDQVDRLADALGLTNTREP